MRIPPPTRSPDFWPGTPWPTSMASHEVVDWVHTLHQRPEDFHEGDLGERLGQYARYQLEEIALDRLDPEEWAVCDDLAQEYADRAGDFPPVIIDEFDSIIDGTHRVNAAVRRGQTTMLAYRGVEDETD